MTPIKYITTSLKKLSLSISNISIKYAYDNDSKFHIIEVSPEEVRRGNSQYMEWEKNIWDEFYDLYPEEDLLISEPDNTNNMDNVLFCKN